jgi:hypothetical protein
MFQIGRADSIVNAGQYFWVTIDGISYKAIAGNEINSTQVIVIKGSDGRLYAFSNTSPTMTTEAQQYFKKTETSKKETEIFFPFQVIYKQTNSLWLAGDREKIQIYASDFSLCGLTNLGNNRYSFALQKDATHIFWNDPIETETEISQIENVRFVGGGAIFSQYIPEIPSVTGVIASSPTSYSETKNAPGYSYSYLSNQLSSGAYSATQQYTGIAAPIEWRYPYRELPLPACSYNDSNTEGNSYQGNLNSNKGSTTQSTLTETLSGNVIYRLNQLKFDTGAKQYQRNRLFEDISPPTNLTLSVNLTCTRFETSANYVGTSNLNFAGRTQTVTVTYNEATIINSPYPLGFTAVRNNSENTTQSESDSDTIIFANYSENRQQSQIYGGVYYNPTTQDFTGVAEYYNNDFFTSVSGTKIYQRTYSSDRTIYDLKLLSSDRSACLFTKTTTDLTSGVNRNSHKNYSLNILNGSGNSSWITDTESYPNNSNNSFKFFIWDGLNEIEIDLSDSFLYWIYQPTFTPPETLPATITISQSLNNLYVRRPPDLNNFVGRDIYILIPNKRYSGKVITYQSTNNNVTSVLLELTEFEDYLTTEVQSNDAAIYFYPQDNCATLLLEHVLGNPSYANFVRSGNSFSVYCAKLNLLIGD